MWRLDVWSDASSYCLIGRLADKTVVGSAPIYILIFPAFLLLIAGDTTWPEGWIFCIWFLLLCYSTILYLYRRDPTLLEERYKQPGCRQPGTLGPVRGLRLKVGFILWIRTLAGLAPTVLSEEGL